MKEPMARGTIFRAFRAAALKSWGESGLRELAAGLPPEAREATIDCPVIVDTAWLPERYVMAWYRAALSGPCVRQMPAFLAFIDAMMNEGFGRVRKLLLAVVTAHQLLKRAPDLWKHDHDTGVLEIADLQERQCNVYLHDHVYVSESLSRVAIAEIYRYALTLCRRVHHVEQAAIVENDSSSLRVTLRWS
jgi:hypothetical protein